MPPIANYRVVWSVCLSTSEPCRKFGSDRDTICVQDSGGPRERPISGIQVFKITHDKYDSDASLKLAYHWGSITRGNKTRCRPNGT